MNIFAISYSFITSKFNYILLCIALVFLFKTSNCQENYIDIIGQIKKHGNSIHLGKDIKYRKNVKIDTIAYFDLFKNYKWDIECSNVSGKITKFSTNKVDTIKIIASPFINKVVYRAQFKINPQLLYKIYALHYDVRGSFQIKINDEVIARTGKFYNGDFKNLKREALSGNSYFQFKDSVADLEIIHLPLLLKRELSIEIGQIPWSEKTIASEQIDDIQNYSLGFYYLAFALVFFFFYLFHKDNNENIYFALFCFVFFLSQTIDALHLYNISNASFFLIIIALEFLSFFFSKIVSNKERTKVPLIIILFLFVLINIPTVSLWIKNNLKDNSQMTLTFFVLIILCYAVFNLLYFLFQGFGKKKWEVKVIVYMCLTTSLLMIVLPISITFYGNINESNEFLSTIISALLGVFPLSAAIVISRRNGINQNKLIEQIQSIEKLSTENLEREKEKKEILEKQNQELEVKVQERTKEVYKQKDEIEVKNKAITDNLNYAQRIQSAILPDVKLIYKSLENSFIIYYPKDIVSGDFYAFAEKNNRVLILAGDCTGHGVSGAFMSMIGISLLNQLINERGLVEPEEILNQLNELVLETFKQSTNETNDGMDVAICSFDLKNYELHFAGANRPLWIIRNDELIVYQPDKFPIGGLQIETQRNFKKHIIPLFKNDVIYIFTDGYADQFGGENGKKMMTGKFKEMLFKNRNLSMKDQEMALREHFENWKGSHEQVDDVLVVGIKID